MGGRTRISLLACLIALGLAGCGSDDGTIPQSQSSDLLALLDNVQETADTGDCDHASEFAREFANRVDELPSDVDADVREELNKAATNLDQLADDSSQCEAPEAGATGAEGVQETTETTPTVEETTTTTTDEEPDTTTSTTEEEEPSTQGPQGNQGDQGDQGSSGQTPPSTPPPTPPSTGNQGQQGGSGGGVEPPSGGVSPGKSAG